MAVGDRIKRARNLRGMTQKELGIAIGFEEKSADIRIAQYESNTRTPKEELLRKIAEVLDVNYRSLYEPTLYARGCDVHPVRAGRALPRHPAL